MKKDTEFMGSKDVTGYFLVNIYRNLIHFPHTLFYANKHFWFMKYVPYTCAIIHAYLYLTAEPE